MTVAVEVMVEVEVVGVGSSVGEIEFGEIEFGEIGFGGFEFWSANTAISTSLLVSTSRACAMEDAREGMAETESGEKVSTTRRKRSDSRRCLRKNGAEELETQRDTSTGDPRLKRVVEYGVSGREGDRIPNAFSTRDSSKGVATHTRIPTVCGVCVVCWGGDNSENREQTTNTQTHRQVDAWTRQKACSSRHRVQK